MKGILCGSNSRSTSSKNTSLIGIMMTILRRSMSWDWDSRPWMNIQINSWNCWGMSGTSKMKNWRSDGFWVDCLSLTKKELSFMSVELLKKRLGRLSIAMSKARGNLITIRHGRKRRIKSLIRGRKFLNLITTRISRRIHHKLWTIQLKWWGKIQEIQKKSKNLSNDGDV